MKVRTADYLWNRILCWSVFVFLLFSPWISWWDEGHWQDNLPWRRLNRVVKKGIFFVLFCFSGCSEKSGDFSCCVISLWTDDLVYLVGTCTLDEIHFIFLHDHLLSLISNYVTLSERYSQSAMVTTYFIFFASLYLIFFIEHYFI